MTKRELLIELKNLNYVDDYQERHEKADKLLLSYIDDIITEEFENLEIWFS